MLGFVSSFLCLDRSHFLSPQVLRIYLLIYLGYGYRHFLLMLLPFASIAISDNIPLSSHQAIHHPHLTVIMYNITGTPGLLTPVILCWYIWNDLSPFLCGMYVLDGKNCTALW